MKTPLVSAALVAAGLLLSSCGNKEEKKDESKDPLAAVQSIVDEADKMSDEAPKEVVDARLLKELLPEDAGGLPRKEASSEKTGAMGFQVATAQGIYRNDDSSIEVNIVDVAGTGAIMALAAWAMVDIDKETESGYEKTIAYKDYKGFEKYNNSDKDGEMAVILAKRFIVSVKGRNVGMDKIKDALDDIDLEKLAGLK